MNLPRRNKGWIASALVRSPRCVPLRWRYPVEVLRALGVVARALVPVALAPPDRETLKTLCLRTCDHQVRKQRMIGRARCHLGDPLSWRFETPRGTILEKCLKRNPVVLAIPRKRPFWRSMNRSTPDRLLRRRLRRRRPRSMCSNGCRRMLRCIRPWRLPRLQRHPRPTHRERSRPMQGASVYQVR